MSHNPNIQSFGPKIEDRNTQETFHTALKVSETVYNLLNTSRSMQGIGFTFFNQYMDPRKIFLLVNNQNIDAIAAIAESGDLDALFEYLITECGEEFEIDRNSLPSERQFSPEVHEFIDWYLQTGEIAQEA